MDGTWHEARLRELNQRLRRIQDSDLLADRYEALRIEGEIDDLEAEIAKTKHGFDREYER